ncbi:putative tripeptidyl-peptidase II [Helianthus anomalus]
MHIWVINNDTNSFNCRSSPSISMGKFGLLIYTIICFIIPNSAQLDDTKTFIVRIQNDAKPSVFADVEHWYQATIGSLSSRKLNSEKITDENPNQDFLHVYKNVFHGFAARLTVLEAKELEEHPSVMAVLPDEIRHLHTTRSVQFMGLVDTEPNYLLKESDYGSNVIIGILDTGISPEEPSFHDQDLGPIPSEWKGECMEGEKFTKNLCNKKVIGARYFTAGYEASNDIIDASNNVKSCIDTNGHGTHTASIAAGRMVQNASLFGFAKGAAVGVAPKARIAAYKICWGENCQESDILAGIDKAVEDGVHVISISLGGSISRPFHLDPIALGAFGAMARGVLVSASAGNSGPDEMTVTNGAPWITTVGASTIDRRFPADLVLDDGTVITGASVTSGRWKSDPTSHFFPLIHGKDASNTQFRNSKSALCIPDSLDEELIKGKIVICDRGGSARAKKGEVVNDAGGVGVIVANVAPQGEGLISDSYTIPGMLITESGRSKLLGYINSTKNPMAKMVIRGTQNEVKPAPVVASFSSRGPSADSVYVLKPDVIAPGVDILAAWPKDVPPSELPSDTRRSGFNMLSGTSMSCPHVSGLAALLKGAHPDWSPAMIRSAMMTTAYMEDSEGKPLLDEQSYNESSVWSTGAGHIDPGKAVDPGLVYDITANDYLRFLCAMNYSTQAIRQFSPKPVKCNRKHNKPWNINYPSISIGYGSRGSSVPEVVVTRTVTYVGEGVSTYNATVTSPKGANVTIEPQTMRFAAKGEKQSYTVKIESDKKLGSWGSMETQLGKLIWSDGKHNVVSPIVVVHQHLL